MRKRFLALAVLLLGTSFNLAAQTSSRQATIISQSSVDCGTKNKGKKQSTSLLCQQYVVHTSTTEYQVRQQKPKSMDIIPPNTPIEFSVNKDKMKFTAAGKKYEFLIVGTTALGANSQ
jgi:hypothetical protein